MVTPQLIEHEQKTKKYTKEKWAEANDGLMAIFAEFAASKDSGVSADSYDVQALVAKLQAHRESGVGMAANMIGVRKRIIAFLDEGGIRHAEGLFVSDVTFEDAKFMLVSCSAFVNYLIAEFGKIIINSNS